MLVAELGDAVVAIPAALVAAVVRAGPVTPLGGLAPWVLGVTAVRGRVLPVGDLRRLAGLEAPDAPPPAAGDEGWHVVLDDGRRAAALAGLRVRRVAAEAEPAAPGDEGAAGLPAAGVVRLEADDPRARDAPAPRAVLLDAAALLDLAHAPAPPTDGE